MDPDAAGRAVSLAETLHDCEPYGADGSPPDEGSTDYVEATGARPIPEPTVPVASEPRRPGAPPPDASGPTAAASIGRSVVMKGELTGSENLVIDGQVEGTINLRENLLTIGSSANISAEILAKSVIVLGRHRGNITGTEKIEIRESGSVDGDLSAPRVAIAEGAHFRGSIDRLTSCPGCRARARRRRLERVPTRPPASRGAAVCRPPQRGRLRRRIVGVSWTGHDLRRASSH